MIEYDDFLKDDFIIIGNKKGEFRTLKKGEPTLLFDFSLDKYSNIIERMDSSDRLIIYYNRIFNRYFMYIVDEHLVRKSKVWMFIFAKERNSSYELSCLLDTMCLKLRNNKVYTSEIDRDNYNIFSK